MRRVAIKVFRSARYTHVRKVLNSKSFSISLSKHASGLRPAFSLPRKDQSLNVLQSSMYFRNFSLALVSGLVATGGWYVYKGIPRSATQVFDNQKSTSQIGAVPGVISQSRGISSSIYSPTSTQASSNSVAEGQPIESTRRALVVENDQFFTHEIVGEDPLSKNTDDAGRKVLEMLTPEQATQKLRRNEESYLVGRGRGVVRYDVVQIPSNDPIEDDHAEKIVEVPQSIAATQDGASSSDWMFWGVFDGHRWVKVEG